jgi:aspartyl protease family protein
MNEAFDDAAGLIGAVPGTQLLIVTLLAMICGWIGTRLIQHRVAAGRLLSAVSTIVLAAVLVTVVLQVSRFDRLSLGLSAPTVEQTVSGGETRVELARDGHFWLAAQVNGVPTNFLVDTGATFTAVGSDLAEQAMLRRGGDGFTVMLATANGMVPAEPAIIEELTVGNISAVGLEAVVLETMGETNVLGMNFLSQLESWRVEGDTLILRPGAAPPAE